VLYMLLGWELNCFADFFSLLPHLKFCGTSITFKFIHIFTYYLTYHLMSRVVLFILLDSGSLPFSCCRLFFLVSNNNKLRLFVFFENKNQPWQRTLENGREGEGGEKGDPRIPDNTYRAKWVLHDLSITCTSWNKIWSCSSLNLFSNE
jgi:hypothetical protein